MKTASCESHAMSRPTLQLQEVKIYWVEWMGDALESSFQQTKGKMQENSCFLLCVHHGPGREVGK